MASSASSVARSSVSDDSSLGHETISMDCTEAPQGMTISEVLLDRRWTFEEVLFIKGASTNLSRRELKETVADVKGVGEERVEVCFFDEDDLTTPVVKDQVLKAGLPKGDVSVPPLPAWFCLLGSACLVLPAHADKANADKANVGGA